MTLAIMIIQCLAVMLYITGVVYWYYALKADVDKDIVDVEDRIMHTHILVLVVSMLWPALVCYNAAKELKVLGKK